MWSASCQPDSCARLLSQDYLTISSPRRETRDLSTWEQPAGSWHGRIAGAYQHWKVSLDFYAVEIFIYLSMNSWLSSWVWLLILPPLSVSTSKAKGDTWKGEELHPWPARPLLPQFSFGRCRKSRRGPSLSFAPRGPCAMRSWLILCFLLPVEGDFNSWWLSRLRMVSWLIHGIIFPQMHTGAKKKRPRNVRGLI